MWLAQYKKTFVGMQLAIAVMTIAMYFALYRAIAPTALFFAILQIGSVTGALWASRLKKRYEPHI